MSQPKISVTIISFNQAKYLPIAIDSALAQTYRPIEIIIADDASSDDSPQIIMDYARRFPDEIVPILADRNLGLAGNRERAIAATTGDYIAWLDADDVWDAGKLDTQMSFMAANGHLVASYHNMRLLNDELPTNDFYYQGARRAFSGNWQTLLKFENFIASSALLYRADALGRRGYDAAEGPTYSDYHFFFRLGRIGPIGYMDEVAGSYRRHGQSATSTIANVRGGVRQRRGHALTAMVAETKGDLWLARYASSRFYLSQLAGAIKARDTVIAGRSALRLIGLLPASLTALMDRRKRRNLLGGFDY